MKTLFKLGALGSAVLVLGACASMSDIDAVDAVKTANVSGGTPFTQALAGEYRRYAVHESEVAGEWDHAARFARKGLMAAKGESVNPEGGEAWGVPAERMADVTAAYDTLMGHFAHGARDRKPVEAAHAQVMLECWMEEEAEGDDDSTCMANFKATEPALRMAHAKPMAMPALPEPFIIYFGFDSFDVDAEARVIAEAVAQAVKVTGAKRVILSGHTDRAGDTGYNKGLSRARVVAAGNAIMEAGVARNMVVKNYEGEGRPQVATPDGAREAKNRRVEVTLER